ncbi:ATP-binding cassette domain-containing protein [Falsiroseomonas sp. HC035]|uniref:ATP-binding cassette domain-containing protein n=1 Tax=Falsiroseomonas sp. HC035 TaxID=3390999 RepID=UPI003D3146B2
MALQSVKAHGVSGPNGAGESTLLRLLGRHLQASSGSMRFGGRPVGAWPRAIYDGLGFYAADTDGSRPPFPESPAALRRNTQFADAAKVGSAPACGPSATWTTWRSSSAASAACGWPAWWSMRPCGPGCAPAALSTRRLQKGDVRPLRNRLAALEDSCARRGCRCEITKCSSKCRARSGRFRRSMPRRCRRWRHRFRRSGCWRSG